jgi:membrane protease YdiL (CAAX protease family)
LPAPLFLSGLIWALWHLPLIFTGEYGLVKMTPGSIAIFAVDIVGLGFVFAWLRLSSGSIWPCILAHGAWNAAIVGAFHDATRGGDGWVGEAGALTAIAVFLYAIALNCLWPLPRLRKNAGSRPEIV